MIRKTRLELLLYWITPISFTVLILSSFVVYFLPQGQAVTILFLVASMLCGALAQLHREKSNKAATVGYYFLAFGYLRNTILKAAIDNIGVFKHNPEQAEQIRNFLMSRDISFSFALITVIGFFLIYFQKYVESRHSNSIE